MKRLLIWVMLLSIIRATTVFATPVGEDDFRGLGKERESLTPELIDSRSKQLEASTSFYLLRFPQAAGAPARIFDPAIWQCIQVAAALNGLDPMVLAGMIFIESFGDPLAKSPTGPAGIGQMTKSSAKEMGLIVGKKIRVGTREETKTRFVGRGKRRHQVVEIKQVPVYQVVDERYDPEKAIMAMARRVANRRAWLGGKVDFAIAEYHMGAGRMTKLLSAYFGTKIKPKNVPSTMAGSSLSYSELFWTNTPYFRPAVYNEIDKLNRVDFSPTYYFRVQQAMRLLGLYKTAPQRYAALASSYRARAGETLLSSLVSSFGESPAGFDHGTVKLPENAPRFGVRLARATNGAMVAERSTIGCLLLVARQLERLQGSKYKGFETSGVEIARDNDTRRASAALPEHTLGWAFDVPRKSLSKDAVRDLNFILTDLRFAGVLAFADTGKSQGFRVVRHPDYADRFEQVYWDALGVPQPTASSPTAVPSPAPVSSPVSDLASSQGFAPAVSQDQPVGELERLFRRVVRVHVRVMRFVVGRFDNASQIFGH